MSLINNELAAKVDELLDKMTLEEKCDLFAGRDMWHIRGCKRLGIPDIRVTDCGHGVTPLCDPPVNGTCFPTGVGQASTWNKELIEEMGRVLGEETQALGNAVLLGPKITLHRVPVGGRNFETYSEDPILAGKLGAALVKGIQSMGTAACIKAFTCNNQQQFQAEVSAELDERTLREIYCTAFRTAIEESDPFLIMTSYNKVNGEYPSGSERLQKGIIKSDWQFKGAIVSDWRAVHGPECIPAGLDLEMPGPGNFLRQEDFLKAVADGIIDEAEVDDRARRILRIIVNNMEHKMKAPEGPETPSHNETARRVAEEAMVLLKNDNGVLPFKKERVKKLALIGPNSVQARLGGGGSASVCPPYSVGPLAGLENLLGDGTEIITVEGCPLIGSLSAVTGRNLKVPAVDGETAGLKAEYFKNQNLEGTPFKTITDRQIDFSWGWASPLQGFKVHCFSIRWTGRLIPSVTGVHTVGGYTTGGGFRLYVNNELLIDRWGNPDGEGTQKITEEASVEVDLAAGEAVDIRFEYNKVVHSAAVRLEWREPGAEDAVKQAAAVAAEADAVVLCGGISNSYEGGAQDRDTMGIPGEQNRLIKEVIKANPNTAVVLYSGNPLDMREWIDDAPAVLQAWYPGQEGGNALARLLFGEVNPSGKLPDTLPARLEDCPVWTTYPGDGKTVDYHHDLFNGYRGDEKNGVIPLFPFGYGLSYTRFKYDKLVLSSDTMDADGSITVSADITNTGMVAGREAVQLYIKDRDAGVPRPVKELKDFAKIELKPGEMGTVTFTVTKKDLSFYDTDNACWTAEPGAFEVMVGTNSQEGLTASFDLLD